MEMVIVLQLRYNNVCIYIALCRCMILYGAATVVVGIACFIFMPDTPYSIWFRLADHERHIMADRMRDNATVQSHTIKKQHVLEALREPRLYCYTLIGFMIMTQNGCMVTFSTQIIVTMGYSVCLWRKILQMDHTDIKRLESCIIVDIRITRHH